MQLISEVYRSIIQTELTKTKSEKTEPPTNTAGSPTGWSRTLHLNESKKLHNPRSESLMDYTTEELQAIRQEHAPGATDSQFLLFMSECKSRNLVPGRHVVFQTRRTQEYDPTTNAKIWVSKPVLITTITALRLIAQRTGEYLGQGREVFTYLDSEGNPTIRSNVPLPDPKNPPSAKEPWVAEVPVYRKGFVEPVVGMARFDAYAATQKSPNGGYVLTRTWSQRNCEMLSKCAEALALRRAFPEETGGLLISEELRPEEDDTPKAVTPASVVPLPPPVPKVDQTPAQPTETPRPGETRSGNAVYADKMSPEEVNRHLAALAEKPKPNEVSPSPSVSTPVENAPVSEKPKRTRKPKEEPRPENGQPDGVTDEDLAAIGTPAPQIDEAANQQAAQEFVEATDPTPTKEEMDKFVVRVRALVTKGKKGDDIKAKLLETAKVDDPKKAPVSVWNKVLSELEAA